MMSISRAADDIFCRVASSYDGNDSVVGRGIFISSVPTQIAIAMESNTVSAQQLLSLVWSEGQGAGEWWASFAQFPMSEFQAYAMGDGALEESAKKWLEYSREENDWMDDTGECGIILIAKKPTSFNDSWAGSESFDVAGTKPGDRLELIEIQYNGGWGWKSLPIDQTITASTFR